MLEDENKMADDINFEREQQALSFNPFGDSPIGTDDRLDREAEPMVQGLDISSLSIRDGRSSSNASSAISARTNPLFEALDNQALASPQLAAGSPKSATASLLNPVADSYTPPSSYAISKVLGVNTPNPSVSNSKLSSSASSSISISIGSGAGSPRRHRLSSASSVKSGRSRRSTSSSLSSVNSRFPTFQGEDDTLLADVEEVRLHTSTPPPPATARPRTDRSSSQESMISLQPSVLSLETASKSPPPVAGYRIPATGSLQHSSFPQLSLCGPAFKDFDEHPLYVCSAILGTAIHPAKAGPHLSPPVRMSFAGKEILHEGRFDLLPITSDMKWCDAKYGSVPEGRVPIQGGYEESGEQLYHALARIQGFWVPGKTGVHLKGANFPFAGREVRLHDGYKVLCWAEQEGSVAASESTERPDNHPR